MCAQLVLRKFSSIDGSYTDRVGKLLRQRFDTFCSLRLDWSGLSQGFPCLFVIWRMTGFNALVRCFTSPGRKRKACGIFMGVLFAPVWAVWSLLVFLFILAPVFVFLFCRYPIRMSRFWTFVLLLAASIYGLAMTITMVVFLANTKLRPRYAIVWEVAAPKESICYCGCAYLVSPQTLWRLFFIGVSVVIQSLLATMRCLKGLRRSQWANLMSVLFPVPVGVYAVKWTTPSGAPIQHRNEGEPVQDELAFDPFALMDEQPESRYTTCTLKPEFAYDVDTSGRWKPLGMDRGLAAPTLPEIKKGEILMQPTEFIGCCGFPCMTGGYQAVIASDSDDEDLETNNGEDAAPPAMPRSPSRAASAGVLSHADIAKYAMKQSERLVKAQIQLLTLTRKSNDAPVDEASSSASEMCVVDRQVTPVLLSITDDADEDVTLVATEKSIPPPELIGSTLSAAARVAPTSKTPDSVCSL
eukprot:TRINITY_DN583_c0_g1_i5.p1 TRINITY_DN583_c0_g1~~TRINITY_DN583_c0_g1_i5.p1  ORF type:complete len:469 (+),score=39.83 TRINITY_DN583_c0_g1_i5:26-1432(+)